MFQLITTICFLGSMCVQSASPVGYPTVESCFHQSAIIVGMQAAPSGRSYAWRADCRTRTALGLTTISTAGSHGPGLPLEIALDVLDAAVPMGSDAIEATID